MMGFLARWREWSRRLRAVEGEWQWCKPCHRMTLNLYRTVIRNKKVEGEWKVERQRRPICADCLTWKASE